jgi:hypothetical protein
MMEPTRALFVANPSDSKAKAKEKESEQRSNALHCTAAPHCMGPNKIEGPPSSV